MTGGIGSGKSTAMAMFTARGAAALSSDQIVHALLQKKEVRREVAGTLGLKSLPMGEDGRRLLADIVFADYEKLRRLEGILYPRVRKEIEAWMETEEAAAAPAAVVEIPMLFEAGMEDMFDHIVLVTAPQELRRSRHSVKVSRSDFERRASRQMPEEEKADRCDFVFNNIGSPDKLDEFVEDTIRKIGCGG